MVNTGYNKQGGRVNLTQSFSEAITGNLNMYFAHSNDRRGITGNDNVGISPYDIFSTTPEFFNMTHRRRRPGRTSQPIWIRQRVRDAALIQTPEEVSRFIGGGNVDARIFQTDHQSLHLTALAGADLAHQTDDFYAPPTSQIETEPAAPWRGHESVGRQHLPELQRQPRAPLRGRQQLRRDDVDRLDATSATFTTRTRSGRISRPASRSRPRPPCSTTSTRRWCPARSTSTGRSSSLR